LEEDTSNQGELFLIPISIEQEFKNDFLLDEDKKKLKKDQNYINLYNMLNIIGKYMDVMKEEHMNV